MLLILLRVTPVPVVLRYHVGRPVLQGCCCCCCTQHGGLIRARGSGDWEGWASLVLCPSCFLRSLGCEGLGMGSDLLHTRLLGAIDNSDPASTFATLHTREVVSSKMQCSLGRPQAACRSRITAPHGMSMHMRIRSASRRCSAVLASHNSSRGDFSSEVRSWGWQRLQRIHKPCLHHECAISAVPGPVTDQATLVIACTLAQAPFLPVTEQKQEHVVIRAAKVIHQC